MPACHSCGSAQADGTKYCTDCGTRIEQRSHEPTRGTGGEGQPAEVLVHAPIPGRPGEDDSSTARGRRRSPRLAIGLVLALLVIAAGSAIAWQQSGSDLRAYGLPAADVATAFGAQGFEPYPDSDSDYVHDSGGATFQAQAVDVATFTDEQQQRRTLGDLSDLIAEQWPKGRALHVASGEGWAVLVSFDDEDQDNNGAYSAQESLLADVRDEIGGDHQSLDGELFDPTGTWSGPVHGDLTDYDVAVDLKFDPAVGLTGEVEYPTQPCSGTWTFESGTADSVTFTEAIDDGLDQCADEAEVIVERGAAGEDEVRLTFVGTEITALLRRSNDA